MTNSIKMRIFTLNVSRSKKILMTSPAIPDSSIADSG